MCFLKIKMDPSDSQISSNLLKLIDEISEFVKAYLKEGEKLLLNCDSSPNFQSIKSILSQLTIEDIGITTKTIPYFFQPQKICGIKVLEEENASISVFCLSKDMFFYSFSLHNEKL